MSRSTLRILMIGLGVLAVAAMAYAVLSVPSGGEGTGEGERSPIWWILIAVVVVIVSLLSARRRKNRRNGDRNG